jgi:hypothetical protein
MRKEAIEALGSTGVALRVEFIWREDRYRHTISLIDGDGSIVPLFESFEGVSEDDWPPSPPLQTLSIERLPEGRQVALLVGMAGRSHWSASVEPVQGQAAIAFDIACRYKPPREFARPPRQLGTRYFPVSPLAQLRLIIAGDGATVADASGVAEIMPIFVAAEGTTRWRYVLSAVAIAERR